MRLLLCLVLTFSLSSSLAEGFFPAEHCAAETQLSKNQDDLNQMNVGHSNSNPKERTDSHNHDCSCPAHGSGCVHTNVGAIAPEEKQFDHLSQMEVSRMAFADRDKLKRKGPYLDEPFQPPRV